VGGAVRVTRCGCVEFVRVDVGVDVFLFCLVFFFQAEDGIRDRDVTGVQTCALPIYAWSLLATVISPPKSSATGGVATGVMVTVNDSVLVSKLVRTCVGSW